MEPGERSTRMAKKRACLAAKHHMESLKQAANLVEKIKNLKESALEAIKEYKEEVEKGVFPSEDQSFK